MEIIQPHGKNIIVGCFYRPLWCIGCWFYQPLESILSTISFENKLYLMGDFKINIFNSRSHQSTNEGINLMFSNGMFPLISKRTRITSSTATLIDNIFTNNLEQCMSSGIPYTDLSDHLPIFHVIRVMLCLFQFWSLVLLRLGFWLYFSLTVSNIQSPLIRINHVGIINSGLVFEISISSKVLVICLSFAIFKRCCDAWSYNYNDFKGCITKLNTRKLQHE